jgi:peptide/nickel transport system permease protein
MLRYTFKRIAAIIPLVIFVTAFVFILGQYGATDLALSLTLQANNGDFDAELYETLRSEMGLDQPVMVRYSQFMENALHGDFGRSYVLPGSPEISAMIGNTLPISLQLGLAAMFMLIVVGVPLGIVAGFTRNSIFDQIIVTSTTFFSAIPAFVLAPLALWLIVAELRAPIVGFGWHGLFSTDTILPAIVLAAGPLSGVLRFTRASVIEVLSHDYVMAARSRGLRRHHIVMGYVIKNSMTPVLSWLGISVGRLLSGSIFVEIVFGIPGFGSVAVTAFQAGDIQTVAATTLVSMVIIIFVNLITDLMYGVFDPRVRLGT